jgi:hypothetical protein
MVSTPIELRGEEAYMTSWGHTPAPARMGESATQAGELTCAPKRAQKQRSLEMDANKWAALALAATLARCKAWAAAELEREALKLQQAAKGLRK